MVDVPLQLARIIAARQRRVERNPRVHGLPVLIENAPSGVGNRNDTRMHEGKLPSTALAFASLALQPPFTSGTQEQTLFLVLAKETLL